MQVTKTYYEVLKAYKDGVRLIGLKGSSRSGKTFALTQVCDRIAVTSKKHRKTSIVSQTYNHLEQGVIYEYEKFLRGEGITRSKVKNTYHINKSVINYFSLGDDPGKAIGPGRDMLWLNEPNKGISFESYVQLRRRTSECVFMDFNPSGKWWAQQYNIFDSDRAIVLHSTWLDNIGNLSGQDIEDFIEMKKLSKTSEFWNYQWKVYGLGVDAVLLEERIFPLISSVSKVPDDAVEAPYGLDFGFFPDPTCFIRIWVRTKKVTGKMKDELYVQQIVYNTKLSIDASSPSAKNLCAILLQNGINKNHLIISESADPRAINDMREAGFSIEAVKKTSVETSIRKFHEYDIYVVDGSPDVFTEFDNYKYAKDKKTNEIIGTPEAGQADHVCDALRYVLLSRGMRWSV
jgi:phage terminase large subunit